MNITTGLMVKGLVGLGAVGATTGVVALASAGSRRDNKKRGEQKNPVGMEIKSVIKEEKYEENEFSKKVEEIMEKVGLKGWCKRRGEKKYVCDGKSSVEGLKKIRFASKYSEDEYRVKNNYSNIGMEILESKDEETFGGGIKFELNNLNDCISIFNGNEKASKDWKYEVSVGTRGEFRFDEKKGGLVWVWQEINDLVGKVGLKCKDWDSESKKNVYECLFNEGTKINIRDGENRVKGVTLESKGKKFKFERLLKFFFQGYKFVPEKDIEVKYDDGSSFVEGKKVEKLYGNKSYGIIRDQENEWYLDRFINR